MVAPDRALLHADGAVGRQFDALIVDYVHPRKFPKLGPTLTWVLRATTAGVLVGVYQFNTNDVGEFTSLVHCCICTSSHALVTFFADLFPTSQFAFAFYIFFLTLAHS